ncbi:MAG: hypothetical protein P1U86_12915 [Verrucomicrobiales bacterium]|nr:hypothetical protein [Verrucomicrobiales bacterium]
MKKYVCMFNDRSLADEVVDTVSGVGFDAITRTVTWNRSNGTTAVTYGVLADELERNRVLDIIAEHLGWHSDLLKCPTCRRPTLEPLCRYGRARFSHTLKQIRGFGKRAKSPVFCRYCRREMRFGEVVDNPSNN